MVPAAVVFVAVVAAVAVAVGPVPAVIVIAPSAAVVRIAEDALLEPADAVVDRRIFLRMEAVARRPIQAVLDLARLPAKTAGFPLADPVAAVEAGNPPLQPVDPDLQITDAAVIVVVVAVARIVAVALARWGRGRVLLLGRGGCRPRQCGNCGGGGNQNLAHPCSPVSG